MYIYAAIILLMVIIVAGLSALTIITIKNVKTIEGNDIELPAEENNKWEPIKDFSDINASSKGKMMEYDRDFDEDIKTTGAALSDYMPVYQEEEINNSVSEIPNIDIPVQNAKDDFSGYEDFNTVSLDNTGTVFDENIDVTANIGETAQKGINVILKYENGSACKLLKMETDRVTVGRGIGNDIILKKGCFASRNHAIFSIKDGRLYLMDLNSKNGTFINSDKRVTGEVEITDSCKITFGDAIVNVDIEK